MAFILESEHSTASIEQIVQSDFGKDDARAEDADQDRVRIRVVRGPGAAGAARHPMTHAVLPASPFNRDRVSTIWSSEIRANAK
jgi:hypothetical protein